MATINYSRQATPDEMAAEIDRRGRSIEGLEAERDRLADSEKFWKTTAASESRTRCDLQSELSTLKRQLEARGGVSEEAVEREARLIAANKMGLVKDPTGSRLPDDLWRQCEEEARAALEASLPLVREGWKPISSAPAGWRLVPEKATTQQLAAGQAAWLADPERRSSTLYAAMVSAAPAQTAKEG